MRTLEHAVHDRGASLIGLTLQNEQSRLAGDPIHGRLAAAVIDSASEGILVIDRSQRIIYVNPAFARLIGTSAQYALGQNALGYLAPHAGTRDFFAELWRTLVRADRWQGETRLCRSDGTRFPAALSLSVIRDERGRTAYVAGTLIDISVRKQAEEQIRYQANYDPITGLPNRTLFIKRLTQALKQANRKHCQAALLFLDMDHFKQINSILGHESGDRLLREVAQRLLRCVRENDSVIRVGGDEFAIVLPEVPRPRVAARVARKVIAALAQPFEVAGSEVSTGASIGIALYPVDADNCDSIRQHADMAMYRAKQSGRGNYQFFAGNMTEAAQRATCLEQDLRHAVGRQELILYYQPILELGSGALVGAEALLRWHHPKRGIVLPEPLLKAAEDSGLLREIGEWALYEAFHEACTWPSRTDGRAPYISVNLSNRQLTMRDGVGVLSQVLESSGLAPDRIVLEITERVMMTEISRGVGQLKSLKNFGLRLALDDFGTGYASLTYLRRFPFDLIKIDRPFIADVDAEDARLVEGILSLSHGLGLAVIAEGVETPAQEIFLKRLGCDYVQGFYYGRPMPADTLRGLLA
ncbi:MAG: EAL domain-containing protein [Nitrococcus mobilis]|nr:EAL domain-containing protein [Nitrococcus mobilis]